MAWWAAIAKGVETGANLWNASRNRRSQENINQLNIDLQREFAQNGIRWRVEDAKRAGIHPLYALGGAGATFSPVHHIKDNSIAQAGQNIGRAITAGMSKYERDKRDREIQAEQRDHNILDKENKRLQNRLLSAQINRVNAQLGKPIPTDRDPETVVTTPLHPDMRIGSDTPAQEIGDQYGDVMGEVYGAAKWFKDRTQGVRDRGREHKRTAAQGDYIREMYRKRGRPVPKHLRQYKLVPRRRGRLPKFERR